MPLLMRMLLTIFADIPRPKTRRPSSLQMRYSPVAASGYRSLSAGGLAASAHMRTRTTYRTHDEINEWITLSLDTAATGTHLGGVADHTGKTTRNARAEDGGCRVATILPSLLELPG
jgi:hypothetical protein